MPTYDYKCRACDHRFEIQQSFTDDALTECPECGGDLRKVFGAVGISFKGSGFYKNDSKSAKASATKKSSESASPASGSSGSDSAPSTGDSGSSGSSSGPSSGSSGEASKPAPAATTT